MNEETHLKIVIAGLITAAGVAINVRPDTASTMAIIQTEKIFQHFTKPKKSTKQQGNVVMGDMAGGDIKKGKR